jgi:MerR family transcriptional regulator, light-induced transcriptional regulator
MATNYTLGPSARPQASGARPARRRDVIAATDDAASLSTIVTCEVIPRLMAVSPVRRRDGSGEIAREDIDNMVALSLTAEADTVIAEVEAMVARGVDGEAILVDLLAPTARILGEYWYQDRCDFVDVTMALWRLQGAVEALRGGRWNEREPEARSALFAPAPGDQHGFGSLIVEKMFERSGWRTQRIVGGERGDLLHALATHWFDIAGLTVSCTCNTADLASTIAAMRTVSHNPRLKVLLGGPALIEDAAIVGRVGADGTASDARAAVVLAEGLIAETRREAMRSG